MLTTRLLLPASFATFLGLGAWFGATGAQEHFEHKPVRGTVSVLESNTGGNIGICAGDDGVFVIDTHVQQSRAQLAAALKKVSDETPRYLLNTHWHFDHTGNNEPFGDERVSIVSHANVRARLAGEAWVEGNKGQDTPAAALPTLTYDSSVELYLNGERIEARHYGPGHTDGDTVVYLHGSKVVHMGDLFFNGRFPFIDSGSGGTPTGYAKSIEAVLAAIDDSWKIIPGHGPIATTEDLRGNLDMLLDCIERVRAARAEGQSVEAMQKAELLGAYAADWSWQFITAERFIADLNAGLAAEGE